MKRLSSLLLVTLIAAITSATPVVEELSRQFRSAPQAYSPVPIWWWSGDRIERDQIRYQLERMAEGGIHNAIILNLAPSGPLYGSAPDDPPFLTKSWWELFGYALEIGKEVGVKLWFYDQLGFSGAGLQARVVRDHPEFRGIELRRDVRTVNGPAEVELVTPPGATALAAFVARTDEAASEFPSWIWDSDTLTDPAKRYFRRTFILDTVPEEAELRVTCNDAFMVYVNGVHVGDDLDEIGRGFHSADRFDVAAHLRAGKNVVAVMGQNLGGPGFLLLDLPLNAQRIVSDSQFRIGTEATEGWTRPEFDDTAWSPAYVIPEWMTRSWGPIANIELKADAPIYDVRNLTDTISQGRLRTKIPTGLHSIQLYYTTPGGFDYQNPDAGKALLNLVHGEMERRFAPELGKSIVGSFQDEFPALPRFSKRLPEEFQKRKNYDLLEYLPALFDDVRDRFGRTDGGSTVQIRCDAIDVAAQLSEEAFFIPLQNWHEKWNLLCGYDQTVRNADPVRGESYYVDYFRTMRHYSAPGNDMDGDCKPHQSIADLYGRPRVWVRNTRGSHQ